MGYGYGPLRAITLDVSIKSGIAYFKTEIRNLLVIIIYHGVHIMESCVEGLYEYFRKEDSEL